MVTQTVLSQDSLVLTLLCTHLGSPRSSGLNPLTDGEWDALAERIGRSALKTPSSLFGLPARQISDALSLEPNLSERVARLLERSGPIAFELERLSSMGIWILTRADSQYPRLLRRRLRSRTPALFYGLGERRSLSAGGVAVVGSRDLDDESLLFASIVGRAAANANLTVFSGGSRGADLIAMRGALETGGGAVGVLVDGLEKSLRDSDTREMLSTGALCLISPFNPNAPFRAGNAMARNKVIYCLGALAVVVASNEGKGGTWAGATEALKNGWIPIFVRQGHREMDGNRRLLELGASLVPPDRERDPQLLGQWLRLIYEMNPPSDAATQWQQDLFDVAWQLISGFLTVPRTESEIGRRFGLVPEQVVNWLETALVRGLASRSTHGWVRGAASDPAQQSLFDGL